MSEDLSRVEAEEFESGSSEARPAITANDGEAAREQALADDETANPMDAIVRPIDSEAGRVSEDLAGVSNIHTGASREDATAAASLFEGGLTEDAATSIQRGEAAETEAGNEAEAESTAADAAGSSGRAQAPTAAPQAGGFQDLPPPAAAEAAPAAQQASPTAPPFAGDAGDLPAAGEDGAGDAAPPAEEAVEVAADDGAADTVTPVTPVTPAVVTPAADPVLPPDLTVSPASGDEDTGIPLDIAAVLGTTDGVTTITLSGLPAGATLSAGIDNGDGTWTLTVDELDGLLLYPAADSDADFVLTVTATTIANGETVTASASLPVTVNAVADAPVLTASAAAGSEDTAVPLDIAASLKDVDGSESLSITITGVPDDAVLSAGTRNADGSWTLTAEQLAGLTLTPGLHSDSDFTLTVTATSTEAANGDTATTVVSVPVSIEAVADAPTLSAATPGGAEDKAIPLDISSALVDADGSESLSIVLSGIPDGALLSAGSRNGDGTWTLSPSDLPGLTITPPQHYSGTFTITVTAVATEAANGDTASTAARLDVTVTPVADAPLLSLSDIVVDEAAGHDGQAIALSNIATSLVDTDGSESIQSVVISGVPDGWVLNHGSSNGDGTWTLAEADLAGLTITPPADYAVNSDAGSAPVLTVTVTSVEAADPSQTATTTGTFSITVNPTADTPDAAAADASGQEGATLKLDLSAAQTDLHGPAETLSVSIAGVPDGFELVDAAGNPIGSEGGDGWSIPATELDNVYIRPENGNEAAQNFSGTIPLTLVVTAADGTSLSDPVEVPFTVAYAGIADTPTLGAAAAEGAEDTAIALDIAAALTDVDGSESLSITIAGVPEGASLSAGSDNGDGTWTLSAADLPGLTITPPKDSGDDFELTVTATSTEDSGDSASISVAVPVTVNAVADTPDLAAQAAAGDEDTAIPLDIASALTDTDGSETLSITIAGVPDGAALSAGEDNGDGTWTLTPAQLAGLTITPPKDSGDDFDLTVTATSTEGENGDQASTTVVVPVTVNAVADAPALTVAPAVGNEDSAIALDIAAALADVDASETLSITVSGVPGGAVLSSGQDNGDGTWTLTPDQLAGLTITPPDDSDADFTLSVTATSREDENGDTATTTAALPVMVKAVADAPSLTAATEGGLEDTAIALDIASALGDVDGSETLSITVAGLPDGAVLSAGTGNGDGSWTLSAADLPGLTVTPPEHYSGTMALTITATATEAATGDQVALKQASTVTTLDLEVAPVADNPTIAVENVVAVEQAGHGAQTIALDNIAVGLIDQDGSESIASVTISGVPGGWTLNHGTDNGDGTWTLSAGDLSGLSVTVPGDYSVLSDGGTAPTLTVTAYSQENAAPGAQGSASASFTVTVGATADAAAISASAAEGLEGVATRLDLSAVQTDAHGPAETLELRVLDVPELFQLVDGDGNVVGTSDGHGAWTITGADLDNVYLAPIDSQLAKDFSGHVSLTFEVTSTDGTDTATVTAPLDVHILGDADVPTLDVASAGGREDDWFDLDITGATTDVDGSESLSYTLDFGSDMAGASVRYKAAGASAWTPETVGSDGTVSLSAAQIAGGLEFRGATHWSGDVTVNVTATATDYGGDTESVSESITFTVTADADDATLNTANATGTEREDAGDPGIPLTLRVRLTDSDGSESFQSIAISGVPDGWTLNKGSYDADTGKWTFTTSDLNASGYINGLTITPPVDYSNLDNGGKPVTLTLEATTIEASNGNTESHQRSFTVSVTPEGDIPDITASDVSGDEGSAIKLDLTALETDVFTSATSVDETLTVKIGGVPDGFELVNGSGAVVGSASGTTWTVTSGSQDAVAAVLDDLYIRPVAGRVTEDFGDGDIPLTMSVTSSDGTYVSDVASAGFTVHYVGVADTPELKVRDSAGIEDTAISLDIRPTETDRDGSELITVRLDDIPEGATLSVGGVAVFTASTGDTSFVLTEAQLSGLTITPPPDSNDDFTLKVTAISTEAGSGDSAEGATLDLDVTVKGDADAPVLVLPLSSGTEDHGGGVPLNLQDVVVLGDDDSANATKSEILSAVISGVPAGFTLSEGQINADGSWSLTPEQLSTVRLIAPGDYSGSVSLTVKAISTERYEDGGDYGTGDVATTTFSLDVDITPVVDDDNGFRGAGGLEDSFISLDLAPVSTDRDGSEDWTEATISDIPAGATLRYTDAAGNTVEQDFPAGGSITLTQAQAAGLAIRPPEDSNEDFALSISAVMIDTATMHDGSTATDSRVVTGSLNVAVTGVADQAAVVAEDVAGIGNSRTVALDITGQLGDADGSETAHYIISNVPQGVVLSSGYNNGDGSWTVTAGQLDGLAITLPSGTDSLDLQVQMVVTENDGDTNLDDAPVIDSFTVTVTPGGGGGGSGPSLGTVAGLEDQAAGLGAHLAARFADADTDSVTIAGIPAGAAIAGSFTDNGGGSITVAMADLAGLTVTPPEHSGDDFTLTVSWSEGGVPHSGAVGVDITPVPDAPLVAATAGAAVEDQPVTVTIDLSQVDRDGSESAFLVIDDLPDGASLVGGIRNADGSWTLPVDREANDQSISVSITPPHNFAGTMSFTVGGVSMEEETGEYVRSDVTVSVDVAARADAAAISGTGGTVAEDTPVSLGLSIGVTDEGESVTQVVIGTLPDGFLLTTGAMAGGAYVPVGTAVAGGIDVTGLDYAGLMVVPRAHYAGSLDVTVSVTTQDGAHSQTNSSSIGLTFTPVTDEATLSVADAHGTEDTAIVLNLGASLVDQDGSEIMAVTISDLPEGGMLSAGTNNGDGSWTLTAGQLDGLLFFPPENLSGEVTLTLSATTMEKATGERATVSESFTVNIDPVADTPDLDVRVASVSTSEDTAVGLSISAGVMDASESLTVVFGNVPDGASFNMGAAGAEPGTWEIPVADAADLNGLTFTPPPHADTGNGSYDLSVTVVATESDGSTASISDALSVTVAPVADSLDLAIADIVVDEAAGHAPQEIALAIDPRFVDADGSEAIASVTVSGVPADWTLNHGTNNGDGSWSLSAGDLTGLTVTVPADYSTEGAAAELTVSVNSFETGDTTSRATTVDSFTITVNPTADAAEVAANDVTVAEGGSVRLDLSAVQTDAYGAPETLSVHIQGIPAGFELVNGSGAGIGSRGGDGWSVPGDGLDDVHLRPEAGNAEAENYSGTLSLTLSVTSQDGEDVGDPVTADFDVTFTPVADTPEITVADATGHAGMEIPLELSAETADPSEILSVLVRVPDRGMLSAGDQQGNDWTLTPEQLPGLTLTLPEDTPVGDYSVTMTVTATDGDDTATATETLTVSVTEVEIEEMAGISDEGTGGGGGDEPEPEPDADLLLEIASQDDGGGDSSGDEGSGGGDGGGLSDDPSMGEGSDAGSGASPGGEEVPASGV